MQASADELKILARIADLDTASTRAEKEITQLEQPAKIDEIRAKLEGVKKKRAEIEAMLKAAQDKFDQLAEEDADLEKRAAEVQHKIDTTEGDHRIIGSLTADLAAIVERREKLDEQMTELDAKSDEISKVAAQAGQAVAQISATEQGLIKSYKEQAGELRSASLTAQDEKKQLSAKLSSEILQAYETARKAAGGIGLAHLQDASCSVCRTQIDENKLLQLEAEAPLTNCPFCKRLLIVDKE